MATTTTKSTPIFKQILAAFAVTVAAVWAYNAWANQNMDDDQEKVVISVVFTSANRVDHPVMVRASVENVAVINEFVTHSPANWVIHVPKGSQVLVSATQETKGDLDCVLQVNGKTVDHNHRNNEGSIRCWHNRKTR